MPVKYLPDQLARVAFVMGSHLLRSTLDHDLTALVASFRSEVIDPVESADHIELVLNYQDGVALIHQPLHHIHQPVHAKVAEAVRGFINQIKRFACGALGELGGQLDPLGFSP